MNKSEEKKTKKNKSQAEHAFLSGMLPQLVSFQTPMDENAYCYFQW